MHLLHLLLRLHLLIDQMPGVFDGQAVGGDVGGRRSSVQIGRHGRRTVPVVNSVKS